MSVKFEGDLKTLVRDLETRGYRVRKAETVAGAAGRTADVFLDNGAVVQWDAYSQRVWADGPLTESQRTETYLRCLYEGGILGRIWVSSLWNLTQSVVFVRSKWVLIKRTRQGSPKAKSPTPKRSTHDPRVFGVWTAEVWGFFKTKHSLSRSAHGPASQTLNPPGPALPAPANTH